tara:strand:- start:15 stop:356 length:342 start_codon:yes stop_codon:yes gene_type:complete
MNTPLLIEPGAKYFLSENLKNCHKRRITRNIIFINVSLLVSFILIVAFYLMYKKKNKETEETKEKRKLEVQNYLLNKVHRVIRVDEKHRRDMITNLPKFESDYELLHEKFYNV